MKILYVTTVAITMGFFPEHIKMLLNEGHTVEVACNCDDYKIPEYCDELGLKVYNISFSRSPLSASNVQSCKELKKIVEEGGYDIIHTHTPNASVCVRFACRKLRKKGLKVFYTAHGFHFCKGAPLKNWLIYYPVEWLCSFWTDTLITINKEDYNLAQKHMHSKKVEYVAGVGIDLNKFGNSDVSKSEIRKDLNIPDDATVLISVGELNENKNHETVIKAIDGLDVYYIIAGVGNKKDYLQELIDNQKMSERIKLLGFRTDVKDLYAASDIFIFPSFREGLSVSLMEAMSMKLPCVVSKIRGNTDLIDDKKGGFCCSADDVQAFKNSINSLCQDNVMCNEFGNYNKEKVKYFSTQTVLDKMKSIYNLDNNVLICGKG